MQNTPVTESAETLLEPLNDKVKVLTGVQKALKSLCLESTLESPEKASGACRVLEQFDPQTCGLDLDFEPFLDAVAEDQRNRLAARRIAFGKELSEAAQAEQMMCRLLTGDPMEFSLPPFTVSVDLNRNQASLVYARLPISEIPAKPAKILAAVKQQLKAIEKGWGPEDFFSALQEAYRMELFQAHKPSGERVEIISLLPRIAFLFQNSRFKFEPLSANYRSYGRFHLAWDLAALRQKGHLEQQGYRLNLGAATGASTKNKKNVLYIEEGAGRGQYYLSLWFTPVS